MMGILQRFQDLAVKSLLYLAALASMTFDRICPGADSLEMISAETQVTPQAMLVRLTTLMIAGSLTMLALGYSASAARVPTRG